MSPPYPLPPMSQAIRRSTYKHPPHPSASLPCPPPIPHVSGYPKELRLEYELRGRNGVEIRNEAQGYLTKPLYLEAKPVISPIIFIVSGNDTTHNTHHTPHTTHHSTQYSLYIIVSCPASPSSTNSDLRHDPFFHSPLYCPALSLFHQPPTA